MEKVMLGLTEDVILKHNGEEGTFRARIDTGATKSSIDSSLAAKFKLGPVVRTKIVKSAHGNSVRPIVHATVELGGKECIGDFTIADRSHMKYKILIGQDILKAGYLIDPNKGD